MKYMRTTQVLEKGILFFTPRTYTLFDISLFDKGNTKDTIAEVIDVQCDIDAAATADRRRTAAVDVVVVFVAADLVVSAAAL